MMDTSTQLAIGGISGKIHQLTEAINAQTEVLKRILEALEKRNASE